METKTPKRRINPWPIAIIAYLALFFAFTITIVVYVSRQKMDLVRGDYYDEEIRYQEQLNRMNRTLPITNQVAIAYNAGRETITISLPPAQLAHGLDGRIRLYRPSDETLDQDIKLTLDANGRQNLDTKKLRAGPWTVKVYWTAGGQDYYYGKSVVVGQKAS